MIQITIFAPDENKLDYNPRELGHKSSTLIKIFGSCTAMGGLTEQGYSPVQTAKLLKSSKVLELFLVI